MSKYQRPWWLLVSKSAGLITTVQEESGPNKRVFIIRGEPLVQGLAWLIWGPVGALVLITILTGLAMSLNVRQQSGIFRILFVVAFLGLPGLAWGIVTIVASRLSKKHLQAERRAEAQACIIRLNQQQGQFFYRTPASPTEEKLAYHQIHEVNVTPAIGARDGKSMRLTLDTAQGPIILLNELLGTQAQKVDLAHEIEASLKKYRDKKIPPS
jgi:hypothetical protein